MILDVVTRNGAEIVTLNAPPMNTFDLPAVKEMGDYFHSFSGERPLILTGHGKAFSAGVDTHAYGSYTAEQRDQLFTAITRMAEACSTISAPVVAALNGHAIGGGLVLALCADYRLVSAGEHKFGLAEAKAGVPFPDGPLAIVRREIPFSLLRKLALTSSLVPKEHLVENHILDEIVEPDRLLDCAIERALELHQQPAFGRVKSQIKGR